MKSINVLLLALFLMPALTALAQNNQDNGTVKGNGHGNGGVGNGSKPITGARGNNPNNNGKDTLSGNNRGGKSFGIQASQSHQPVVININKSSSGGHNRNFPSQQSSQSKVQTSVIQKPSYSRIQRTAPAQNRNQPRQRIQSNGIQKQVDQRIYKRPSVQGYSKPNVRAAVAVHRHAYTPGYVRKKLQKIGVKSEPKMITDRAEFVHTDRQHSIISFPKVGENRVSLKAQLVSSRHFNDAFVRNHMGQISTGNWTKLITGFNTLESGHGRYYWHKDNGFDYCHYVDDSGYHWWGWYKGKQFFWTRYYGSRWWWYDTDFDRWCFWNEGFWWWQDPFHVGDLYVYNNNDYISANSANDQVVVTAPVDTNSQAFNSPDATRTVKITGDSQDAFLYDTADPPSFDPVYLASGVQNVQFSNTSNGKPLEIIVTLNDGSFDMFDDYGNPYNSGSSEGDQSSQDSVEPPPSNVGTTDNMDQQ